MPYRTVGLTVRLPILIVTVALVGCSSLHFEIAMRPDGDGMERVCTLWRTEPKSGKYAQFPAEELAAIASAYGAEPPTKRDQKQTFRGHFVGKMPIDARNSGSYTRWTSRLGTASMYLERFGGSDDLAHQFDKRRVAANRIVDLTIAWLETELGKDPNWLNFRRELDTSFRRDFENLLHTWVAQWEQELSREEDPPTKRRLHTSDSFGPRLLQFGMEHGYIEPRDFSLYYAPANSPAKKVLLDRWIGRHLGLTDNASRSTSLAFLKDDQSLEKSLDRFLRDTPEYGRVEREMKERKERGPAEGQPTKAEQVIGLLLLDAVFGSVEDLDPFSLKVTIDCPEAPIETNGTWNKSNHQIRWTSPFELRPGLPMLLYASWSEPDEMAQQERFGETALTGKELFQYVMTYAGLSKNQATEWDEYLAAASPGSAARTAVADLERGAVGPLAETR